MQQPTAAASKKTGQHGDCALLFAIKPAMLFFVLFVIYIYPESELNMANETGGMITPAVWADYRS